jgi:AcrR family transcriptional regulator
LTSAAIDANASGRPDVETVRLRVGRRRDQSRDRALCQAALELIAEVGYDRMTIDAVAARAGAGKATVYRRWSTKADLVVDAFAQDATRADPPDTGSLRGDLTWLSRHLFAGRDQMFKTRLISGMVSAMLADPQLRKAFEPVSLPPVRALEIIIDRAVARGEIAAPADPGMLAAVLPALGMHQLIFTGQGPDPGLVDAVVEHLLLPALLARSEPPATKSAHAGPEGRPSHD